MGTRYFPIPSNIVMFTESAETEAEVEQEQFLLDFKSKIWCSYRRDFDNIGNTKFTSDSGWGCMLRSGQMVLAAALTRHFLGPKWRLGQIGENPESAKKYNMILSWFLDQQGPISPYSLPNLSIKGMKFDTPIGQWHGPTTTAFILRKLINQHSPGGLKAYVSQDATVYRSEVAKLCQKQPKSDDWESVIILLPVRLGVELNFSYLPFLAETFKFPQSLGFAGGKIGPSLTSVLTFGKLRTQRATRSMYFVAVDDKNGLYYLDPHKTQDAVRLESLENATAGDFNSYHYLLSPKKTTIDQIDPSLMFGFYCRNKEDFEDFCQRVETLAETKKPPIFVIGNKRPVYKQQVNMDPDENDTEMRWKETEEWANPIKVNQAPSQSGNPRPQMLGFEMKELVSFRSANGDVMGILVLNQGYLVFEPIKQDPLVKVNGFDLYRWWIRVPFLESCKVLTEREEESDVDPNGFVLLHSLVEREDQPTPRLVDGDLPPNPLTPSQTSSLNSSSLLTDISQNEGSLPRNNNNTVVRSQSNDAEHQEEHEPETSGSRGFGSNPNILNIVHGVDVRTILVAELKSALNWCHLAKLHNTKLLCEASNETIRLVNSIELIFQNGLKEKSTLLALSSQLLDFTKGKVPQNTITFWPMVEKVLFHENYEFIQKNTTNSSEAEKCRIWIRLALNEGVLYNYLTSMLSDIKMLQQIYSPKAILLDSSHCEVVKTLFYTLFDLSFQLPVLDFQLTPAQAPSQSQPEVKEQNEIEDPLSQGSNREPVAESSSNQRNHFSVPTLDPPAQVRLTVRDGPLRQYFNLEVQSDKVSRICETILSTMDKFRVPLAK